MIQGTPELLSHATEFYKGLFGQVADSGVRFDESSWTEEEKLSEEERSETDRPFTEDEIKKIVEGMEKNKAPGPAY